jgi:hypothetical protein
MPYMELRNYINGVELETSKRDKLMRAVRDTLARGEEIDGTWEYKCVLSSENDYCEYDYILVIDMGWSQEREAKKALLATEIGNNIALILESNLIAVRLRLQNAAFVPINPQKS